MTVHYREGALRTVCFGRTVKCGVYGWFPMYSGDKRKVTCGRCIPKKNKKRGKP